jgi:hypothetical protein
VRATLLVPLQGLGELCVLVFVRVPRTVPACSFYSLKEVQGYKMLVCDVILVGEGAPRPREPRWRRGLHCRGMALVLLALLLHVQACVPLLREWFLSFGAVATCPVVPGPVAGVACSSMQFDWRRGPRPLRHELQRDLIPDRGNSGLKRRFVHCAGTNRAYSASMGGIVASSSSPCLLWATAW